MNDPYDLTRLSRSSCLTCRCLPHRPRGVNNPHASGATLNPNATLIRQIASFGNKPSDDLRPNFVEHSLAVSIHK